MMKSKVTVENDSELHVCYFSLFDNCNVKCNMCDCWARPRTHLNHEHYKEVLSQVLSLKPTVIRFTGGEPMLLRTLPRLVKQAKTAGTEVSVITNGRIAHSKVESLRDVGLDLLVISLDGLVVEHEAIRGVSGLWNNLVRTIKACEVTKTPYAINTVVQQRNYTCLEQLATFLSEGTTVKPMYWHLIPVRGEKELVPSAEQHVEAVEYVMAAAAVARAAGIHCIYDPRLSFDLEPPTAGCNVPNQTMYIRADSGDCYGCNMLAYASQPVGNIFESPIADIWHGSRRKSLINATCAGRELACSRCDVGSREMNHFLAHPR